jgi:hypothetical protein
VEKATPCEVCYALNREFAMGVAVQQVNRHYRDYKEKWKIIERALNNSENGFDVTRCKIIVSESEKEKLNVCVIIFIDITNFKYLVHAATV